MPRHVCYGRKSASLCRLMTDRLNLSKRFSNTLNAVFLNIGMHIKEREGRSVKGVESTRSYLGVHYFSDGVMPHVSISSRVI